MKLLNKYFFISLIMAILNGLNNTNSLYKYIVFLQIGIIFLMAIKNIKKAFILHIIFLLTSTAFFADLRLINEKVIINYSKLKFIGNISYSYLPLLFFVAYSFGFGREKRIKNLKNKELNFFLIGLTFFNLYPIVLGGIGLILNPEYNLSSFLSKSIYSMNVVFYSFAMISILEKEDYDFLQGIIINLLTAGVFSAMILKILGYSGYYGGINKLSTLDIIEFASILILNDHIIYLLVGIIYLINFKFIASGKGILILLVTLYRLLNKFSFFRKYKIILIPCFLFFFINLSEIFKFQKNEIIYYKFQQFLGSFKFYDLNLVPHSPKVRIIEMINIAYQYLKFPLLTLFGFGFGGYFKDWSGKFSYINLKEGDFSLSEINRGIFYGGHDTFSNVFLFNGIFGIIFILYWILQFWKKKSKYGLNLIPIFWLGLIYYFNIHIAIFGLISIYTIFIEKINMNKN